MKRKPVNPRATDRTDQIVGAHIRRIRLAKGVTQEKLAADIGVTFQQTQKYEGGVNRVSVSRLLKISRALGETIDKFVEGA